MVKNILILAGIGFLFNACGIVSFKNYMNYGKSFRNNAIIYGNNANSQSNNAAFCEGENLLAENALLLEEKKHNRNTLYYREIVAAGVPYKNVNLVPFQIRGLMISFNQTADQGHWKFEVEGTNNIKRPILSCVPPKLYNNTWRFELMPYPLQGILMSINPQLPFCVAQIINSFCEHKMLVLENHHLTTDQVSMLGSFKGIMIGECNKTNWWKGAEIGKYSPCPNVLEGERSISSEIFEGVCYYAYSASRKIIQIQLQENKNIILASSDSFWDSSITVPHWRPGRARSFHFPERQLLKRKQQNYGVYPILLHDFDTDKIFHLGRYRNTYDQGTSIYVEDACENFNDFNAYEDLNYSKYEHKTGIFANVPVAFYNGNLILCNKEKGTLDIIHLYEQE